MWNAMYPYSQEPDLGPHHLAAITGHASLLQLILDNYPGTQTLIDNKDSMRRTALQWAAERGHRKVVRLLLSRGADFDSGDQYGRPTALLTASRRDYEETVQILLDAGAGADDNDDEALYVASSHGREKDSASSHVSNQYGKPALHLASGFNCTTVVRILLDAGADVNAQDYCGGTDLLYATENGYHEVVRILVDADTDVNYKYSLGDTALLRASQRGHQEIVKILLDADAETWVFNDDGQSPRNIASDLGYTEIK